MACLAVLLADYLLFFWLFFAFIYYGGSKMSMQLTVHVLLWDNPLHETYAQDVRRIKPPL
jgi:hypothetical protein